MDFCSLFTEELKKKLFVHPCTFDAYAVNMAERCERGGVGRTSWRFGGGGGGKNCVCEREGEKLTDLYIVGEPEHRERREGRRSEWRISQYGEERTRRKG